MKGKLMFLFLTKTKVINGTCISWDSLTHNRGQWVIIFHLDDAKLDGYRSERVVTRRQSPTQRVGSMKEELNDGSLKSSLCQMSRARWKSGLECDRSTIKAHGRGLVVIQAPQVRAKASECCCLTRSIRERDFSQHKEGLVVSSQSPILKS